MPVSSFSFKTLLLLAVIFLSTSCNDVKRSKSSHPHIDSFYEIYLPHWGESDAISAVEGQLGHLRALFVESVIFSPLQPVSDRLKIGRLGSPYAIKDHGAFNQALGDAQDFKNLVAELQRSGIKVFMDWYPTICAYDNELADLADSLDLRSSLNDRHNLAFNDVTLVDFQKKGNTEAMLAHMVKFVTDFQLDGLRLHYTSLLPKNFIQSIRKKADIVLIAGEGENDVEQFDYFMNYNLFDAVKSAFSDSTSLESVKKEMTQVNDGGPTPINFSSNQFVSSRSDNNYSLLGNRGRLSSAVAFMNHGSALIQAGQEIPITRPINLYSSYTISWPKKNMMDVFREFILLRGKNKALHLSPKPEVRLLDLGSDKVVGLEKKQGGHMFIGIFNFSDSLETIVPKEAIFNVNDYQRHRPIQMRAGEPVKMAPGQFLLFTNI